MTCSTNETYRGNVGEPLSHVRHGMYGHDMSNAADAADALDRAATYIDEHGWIQGSPGGWGGPACAWGAIIEVTPTEWPTRFTARQTLEAIVGRIGSWNDAPGRTHAEVTSTLRLVAANLRGNPLMDLITTSRTAQLLGVSRRTVQRMANAGTLTPALTVPSGHLFHLADINAYKARNLTPRIPQQRTETTP